MSSKSVQVALGCALLALGGCVAAPPPGAVAVPYAAPAPYVYDPNAAGYPYYPSYPWYVGPEVGLGFGWGGGGGWGHGGGGGTWRR